MWVVSAEVGQAETGVAGEEVAVAQVPPQDPIDPNTVPIPVLVIACNRPTVKRNLDQLLKYVKSITGTQWIRQRI